MAFGLHIWAALKHVSCAFGDFSYLEMERCGWVEVRRKYDINVELARCIYGLRKDFIQLIKIDIQEPLNIYAIAGMGIKKL